MQSENSACPESSPDACRPAPRTSPKDGRTTSIPINKIDCISAACPESSLDAGLKNTRRDFLKTAALIAGGAAVGGALFGRLPESSAISCGGSAGKSSSTGPLSQVSACCPTGVAVLGGTCTGTGVQGFAKEYGTGVEGYSQGNLCTGEGIGIYAASCYGSALVANSNSLSRPAICSSSAHYMIARFSNYRACGCLTALIQFQTSPASCTQYQWNAGVAGARNGLCIPPGTFFFEQLTGGATHGAKMVINKCGDVGIGTINPTSTLCVQGSVHGFSCAQTALYGNSTSGTGVRGNSTGVGVQGCSPGSAATSYGVHGHACNNIGVYGCGGRVGVMGVALSSTAIPIIAKGASSQSANLQQWENSSGTALSAVNKCGHFGIGTCNPGSSLCVLGNAIFAQNSSTTPTLCVRNPGQGPGLVVCTVGTTGTTSAIKAFGSSKGIGVFGRGSTGVGGYACPSTPCTLFPIGVCGELVLTRGSGVRGLATACKGAVTGVVGQATASACGTGVSGSGGKLGVFGSSPGVAVQGTASTKVAIPFVAQGASCQSAPLQEWRNHTGTSLSVVNACGWLGVGTSAPANPLCVGGKVSVNPSCTLTSGTTLQVKGSVSAKVVSVTAAYIMGATDFAVLANAATAGFTINLPKASTAVGMIVHIKKIDIVTTNIVKVAVAVSSGDKIEGGASKSLTKHFQSLTLYSDGNSPGNWYILSSAT